MKKRQSASIQLLTGRSRDSKPESIAFIYGELNPLSLSPDAIRKIRPETCPLHAVVVAVALQHPPFSYERKVELIDYGFENQGEDVDFVNKKNVLGMTALHTAVSVNVQDMEICKLLIERGADVNAVNNYDYNTLFMAIGSCSPLKIIRMLLDNGADPNMLAKTDEGKSWYVAQLALIMSNEDYLKILVKYGANLKLPVPNRRSAPINFAQTESMRRLLERLSRKIDRKEELANAKCALCSATNLGSVNLKRCGRCYVTFYCSREHQEKHWARNHWKNCPGYIVVGHAMREKAGMKVTKKIDRKYLPLKPPLTMKDAWACLQTKLQDMAGKYFVYKALAPPEDEITFILYTNDDQSIQSWHYPEEKGFFDLCRMIRDSGSREAFFWATPDDPHQGTCKIFTGRFAPVHDNW
uniref:uncharacterized protein LOC113474012 n=1 Tax=Ciona intestinalis TaxID=7719 RepID=UPI0002B8D5D7|nr:uncharacterized protein LOC113474012 [Ciona intestinalis]|eukprot:XP_026691855.1 uncharacterized protein LOC113474012 [Ciona intestinalis]